MKAHIVSACFILLLLLLQPFGNFPAVRCCLDHEREALSSFKSRLSDPSCRLSSWEGENCCKWKGVTCSDSLHVIAVNLRNPDPDTFIVNQNDELVQISDNSVSTSLKGTLFPSLFSLSELLHLDLSYNDFLRSKLPEKSFTNLSKLTYLNLSNSNFGGPIDTQFVNLTALESLDLSCAMPVMDYSKINLNVSSDLLVESSSLYSYISGWALSSRDVKWLKPMRNLQTLVLAGVDLSIATISSPSQWSEPLSSLYILEMLVFSNCSIFGKIPTDYGFLNLSHLSYLAMNFNSLASPIPIEFGNLTSLSFLDSTNSDIRGQIPHLPQLSYLRVGNNSDLTVDLGMMFSLPWPKLEVLDVHSTRAIGLIPSSISNTTSLINFIAYDAMIMGPLPSSITNMSNLEVLLLNFNGLTGEIPSLSGMASLGYLSLMQNSLEGPIPDSICSLSSLWYLVLAGNKLTGTLPGCIGDLPDLKYILIGINAMNGSIGSLGSLSRKNSTWLAIVSLGFSGLSLTDQTSVPVNFNPIALDLSSCRLSGKIPEFISKLTELEMLRLGYNNLSGTIPDWLFKLPNLGYLDLSSNNLEGVLPSTVNLKKYFGMTSLVVSDNHLQGAVPVLGSNMDLVDLSWNDLTGEIPERSKLGKVKSLSLSGNKLTGQIPDSWCEIGDSLMLLDISSNGLSGPIPLSLGGCKSLVFLNLTMNQFSGEIPPDLFENGKGIRFLGLGNNLFDSMFPRFIQGLENLEVLKMERNRFRGPIPQFISNLTRLRILILEENFFNGSIPEGLTNLKELQYLDFSNNNLSGPIPEKLSFMTTLRSRCSACGQLLSVGVKVHVARDG